jgi:hypothetical protein
MLPGEARTHGQQIIRLTRCLLRYGSFYDVQNYLQIKPAEQKGSKFWLEESLKKGYLAALDCKWSGNILLLMYLLFIQGYKMLNKIPFVLFIKVFPANSRKLGIPALADPTVI